MRCRLHPSQRVEVFLITDQASSSSKQSPVTIHFGVWLLSDIQSKIQSPKFDSHEFAQQQDCRTPRRSQTMACNYDYELRLKSTRRHRSSRHVEYEPNHSSYAPTSYRNRYRDLLYPTHYPDTTYRTNITNLPGDIKLSVFDYLDPVSSACLGLSSRHLYPSHKRMHRNVGLYEQADGNVPLCFQLRDWAPEDLMLDPRSGKYVSRERFERGDERSGKKRHFWDGRLRRVGKVVDLRHREEKLRRVERDHDLRERYYGRWR
ncbi:uncharacterized protein RCO7_15231 [Rhynchosporium graminicola]|uniref:F-box domain-containing protein n=1 Tax=Rhynchosporium graminicola TaxID=2792576 RepID=A0A1E1LRZ1_9HELO|nr:uncharacterized protein RCO7_15231 [Rhynchosporium commune]